jgi:hypothetical protein
VLASSPAGHRGEPDALNATITVPRGGIVLRARGYRTGQDGKLVFYTNPIRLTAPAR